MTFGEHSYKHKYVQSNVKGLAFHDDGVCSDLSEGSPSESDPAHMFPST